VAILRDKVKGADKELSTEEVEEYVKGRGMDEGPFGQEQIDEAWAGLQN